MSIKRAFTTTFMFFAFTGQAVAAPSINSGDPQCQTETRGYSQQTPLGVFTFRTDDEGPLPRYGCLGTRLLAQTRRVLHGGYYSFTLPEIGYGHYALDANPKKTEQVYRMVIQEDTGPDCDNKYWLLDFRGKEPLVVGPFGDHDCSERFYVIWGNETVAIAVYVDKDEELSSTPRRLELDDQGEEAYERDDRTGALLPLYNSSGNLDSESSVTHEGYIYSYKTKKVTKAIIED